MFYKNKRMLIIFKKSLFLQKWYGCFTQQTNLIYLVPEIISATQEE